MRPNAALATTGIRAIFSRSRATPRTGRGRSGARPGRQGGAARPRVEVIGEYPRPVLPFTSWSATYGIVFLQIFRTSCRHERAAWIERAQASGADRPAPGAFDAGPGPEKARQRPQAPPRDAGDPRGKVNDLRSEQA